VSPQIDHEVGAGRADTGSVHALAERQWHDYQAREPGTCFSDPGFSLDVADAYALQDAVAAIRVAAGDPLVGYKVGCTGAGTVQQFGMAGPIRGCLFGSEIRKPRQAIHFNSFANLAIEGEMALRVGDNGAIEAVFPVIELHHFVFRGERKSLPELIANNGLNGGFVLPNEAWQASRKYAARPGALSVHVNGKQIARGDLWPMSGGAEASLDWLGRHLAEFGYRLRPGQIVLAGTPLDLYPVQVGDRISVFVDDRIGAECSVL